MLYYYQVSSTHHQTPVRFTLMTPATSIFDLYFKDIPLSQICVAHIFIDVWQFATAFLVSQWSHL